MFVLLIEDDHTDVELKAFEDKHEAIAKAKELAKKWVSEKYPNDYEESDYPDEKVVFYVRYSSETGTIKVVDLEVKMKETEFTSKDKIKEGMQESFDEMLDDLKGARIDIEDGIDTAIDIVSATAEVATEFLSQARSAVKDVLKEKEKARKK